MIEHKECHGPGTAKGGKESDMKEIKHGTEEMESISKISTAPIYILSYLENLGLYV